ncbi:hypothetical protein LWI28_007917 [Acer negundo]|uniref:Uncharacterized protein n=1 Tax=Acer negundo TaxID=4023 RepID=A0AAD5IIR8_ACENE|nr:hypothetical protein LWI28_007917 [Acer negundo]
MVPPRTSKKEEEEEEVVFSLTQPYTEHLHYARRTSLPKAYVLTPTDSRLAKRERARRRKGQTFRPNGNEQRRNDKRRCSEHPQRRVKEGFWPVAFPVPPSSGGACVEGVPPEIGLEVLALPTSRQLMAVSHDYYLKAPMKMNISHKGVCICEKAEPDAKDSAYATWDAENSMVMAWLVNSMEEDISANYLGYLEPRTCGTI